MQLNPDCVRDVLIEIEAIQTIDSDRLIRTLRVDDLQNSKLGEIYTSQDIYYSIHQLASSCLIDADEERSIRYNDYRINDITPEGHEFLNNVRNNDVWSETKNKAKQVGSFALGILSQIAASVIGSRINFNI